MKFTRRNFILTSGMATLTATVLSPWQEIFGQTLKAGNLFPIPPESTSNPLNYLKREHFEPFINSFFQVQKPEGRIVKIQLIEAADLRNGSNEKQGFAGDSYSLLFQDAKNSKLPQGAYEMNHSALGKFTLLLVPTGLRGNRYESIINRINV